MNRPWCLSILVALALGGAACGDEPEPARPSARPVESLPDEPPEPVTPPPGPPRPVEDPEASAEEASVNRALASAAEAAEQAPRGSDTCETALNGLLAMMDTVDRELHQHVPRPDRDGFLEVCREMPPAAQRCVTPTYAFDHQEECQRTLEALPEDVRQRFETAVQGHGAD